jgi:uncharacterized SAM-binding protein YcdF (DUF218 family)
MNQEEIDRLAKVIWDYHHLNQTLEKADCIFVLCSMDTSVADYAVNLYKKGYAPYILFSGGSGKLTKDIFDKPEALVFKDIALASGVQEEAIIVETESTNTGENVSFSRNLLNKLNLDFNSFILVQKPYMERRTYATFHKVWPEKDFTVTSPQVTFEEYTKDPTFKELTINVMVGDLQRIHEYPKKGFQVEQVIPESVWECYNKLVQVGYNKHLIEN